MKRFVVFIMGIISFLGLDAQCVSGLDPDFDTLFCITIHCYHNDKAEPDTYTFLSPLHDDYYLDISNHDTLLKSLKKITYPISDFFFSLYPMIKASFPDSSLAFQESVFYSNLSKWIYYNSQMSMSTSRKFHTKTEDYYIINVAKVMAITKQNINGFPLAISIIKDIVSVSLNNNCIMENLIVLSKYCFSEM